MRNFLTPMELLVATVFALVLGLFLILIAGPLHWKRWRWGTTIGSVVLGSLWWSITWLPGLFLNIGLVYVCQWALSRFAKGKTGSLTIGDLFFAMTWASLVVADVAFVFNGQRRISLEFWLSFEAAVLCGALGAVLVDRLGKMKLNAILVLSLVYVAAIYFGSFYYLPTNIDTYIIKTHVAPKLVLALSVSFGGLVALELKRRWSAWADKQDSSRIARSSSPACAVSVKE